MIFLFVWPLTSKDKELILIKTMNVDGAKKYKLLLLKLKSLEKKYQLLLLKQCLHTQNRSFPLQTDVLPNDLVH